MIANTRTMSSKPRPTKRGKGKTFVGYYATPEEKNELQAAADKREISLAELFRRLARKLREERETGEDDSLPKT
jgi:hypothetical protein